MTTDKRFLRRPEVQLRTGLAATTIYMLEKQGKFPAHFLLTPRCAVWTSDAIEAWMAEREKKPAARAPVPAAGARWKGKAAA